MNNENIKTLVLPRYNEEDIEKLTLVNPIEFLPEEENEYILETLKKRLEKANKPNNWMPLEECIHRLQEKLDL